ncbi:protein 108-like [Magnolia sinica]|uniref:protein 108-like n=1 Tax=Magnolia sinica TaxID=86752 RepID=UPI002658216D|nr:protein 108-like [Magnolia sinica]
MWLGVMAAAKSILSHCSMSQAVVVLFLLALMAHTQVVQSQNCTAELIDLNSCAPYVVPGATASPNSQCCSAVREVNHDCLCNTMRIVSQIPTQCNLPPITCVPGP